MTEYALVVALLIGLLAGASFVVVPDFIEALQAHYDSFYIMLNLPIP